MGRVVYLGAFLTPASRAALLAACPPQHDVVEANHVTIAFGPSAEQVAAFARGTTVRLTATALASDDRCAAVVVSGTESSNAVAHITLSRTCDTKPVYSNQLLARGTAPIAPIELEAVLDTFPRSQA